MTETTEPTESTGWDRRRFIKASAGGAALIWAAPTITGLDARAYAVGSDPDCQSIFNMNIDSEPVDQLSQTGAVGNLNVTAGNVDVIGAGGSFDFQPGNGKYLDLDGTGSSNPVSISTGVNLMSGSTYRVTITLAGANTLGGPPGSDNNNTTSVEVGGVPVAVFVYSSSVPFQSTSFFVTGTGGPLMIEHDSNPLATSGDNVGMLLKDIVIQIC